MPRGDRLDNPALDDFVRQLTRCPVGHRGSALLWLLASHRDDLGELFRTEPGGRSGPRLIRQQVADEFPQILVAHPLPGSLSETSLTLSPTSSPTSNTLSVDSEDSALLDIAHSIGREQDDRASFDQLRWSIRLVLLSALQDGALLFRDRDASGAAHLADSLDGDHRSLILSGPTVNAALPPLPTSSSQGTVVASRQVPRDRDRARDERDRAAGLLP